MANPFHGSYIVTQNFGPTDFPSEPSYTWNGVHYQRFHLGLDLVGPSDTCPIYAIMPGTVFAAGTDTDGANYVIVQSPNYFVAFWHLSAITCQSGQQVDTNTQIGNQGTSGNSTGYHLHLQLMQADHYGHGLNSTGTPVDPAPFIFDKQGATPTDMNPLKIAKDLYAILDPGYNPPDSVILDKANAIVSIDSLIPVLHDLLDAKPWRSPEEYNFAALQAYATAKGFPDPKQYAFDRVSGGDTFDTVITGDLSADEAEADHVTQLYQAATAQLNAFSQAIHALQNQVATLNDENQSLHIALEKTEQPVDHTPEPQPAAEPVPADQPDQTTVEDPTSQPEPARMSYLAGLYYLLSKLFLGR